MSLFQQNNFFAGLDTELDPTKTPKDSYRLLINGRARRDVIEPTNKHVRLSARDGNYQGIFCVGDILVLFIDGIAYYADIQISPIVFFQLSGWSANPMTADVPRIYAEIVPVTTNFLNNSGTPLNPNLTFNGTIKAFPAALFVWDGTSVVRPRAIFPDGTWRELKDYNDWFPGTPEYVPNGLLPAVIGNKLFLSSVDRKRILSSVSGRCSDFVVNITTAGDKGGDAETTATAVSLNDITSIKPLANGQVLVSTLYASFALALDYNNTIFGEPYLAPIFLFPTGAVNDLSSIPITAQTSQGLFVDNAFITQSGIHGYNAVAQTQKESNNYALGAKIKGLLVNPQADTCATMHDDYGFFAVNTIFGYGALVYDTVRQNWTSLDLSFGRAKQFANARIAGRERLFFITHENQVFEAFASEQVNSSHIYLGEWTPGAADSQSLTHMVDAVFVDVKSSGQAKMTVYADGEKHDEVVLQVNAAGYVENLPIIVPGVNAKKTHLVGWQLENKARAWNVGVYLEWNFNGKLSEISLDGQIETSENVSMEITDSVAGEDFVFIGSSGYSDELNTYVDFPAEGFLCVPVISGSRYIYFANGNGRLVNGKTIIHSNGVFTANGMSVAIEGVGAATFALRTADNFLSVLRAIRNTDARVIIHGGNLSFPLGSQLDVEMGIWPLNEPIQPVVGAIEYLTDSASPFFNTLGVARYYKKRHTYIEFFFYNGSANEPDGRDEDSKQAMWLRSELAKSTAVYKIIVINEAPYSTADANYPGVVVLRLPFAAWGASAVLAGQPEIMERIIVNGFPYFNAGVGGHGLDNFEPNTTSAFRENTKYGFLRIESDPLNCTFSFIDTNGLILDQYAIQA